VDESVFNQWTPAPAPAVAAPGTITEVTLTPLSPNTTYAISLRAKGVCGWSNPTFNRVSTTNVSYQKLSGCVIATAAYGSDLHPDVALLRHERDWAAVHSSSVKLAALLYADSAPPLAALIARSQTARQVVRAVLRPFIAVNRALRASAPLR
jgi:hypothetical protein